jgi:hypothetical protein
MTDIKHDVIFQSSRVYTLFGHNRNEEISEEMKVEPVDKKLRRY